MTIPRRLDIRSLSSWLCLCLVAAVALAGLLPSGMVARAQSIDPADVTLTIDDLPPGYSVDPTYTRDDFQQNVGPSHQVQFERDPTPENLAAGPVVVGQTAIRLDGSEGAGDALHYVRTFQIEEQGFSVSDTGPNDDGTFTLQKSDGGVSYIMVGFIKENWIIVTLAAGLRDVVTYHTVLDLAGISSARLDARLGH